ncbi:cyclodeaminase/cyclohydrolase family protein [Petrotoga sp. 9PWA.NaAc.5.4]|uniref:cyclodeaminase/cyclohydrolase family protein n=1 Tax=Petrotoga sp. 9PWA.NaAc.5.4 TaxID=1434328 RepID=UPI000CB56B62|nr:cyclodeaminase/cyclohydrolase family protein [Petrotoga sp. 9PWA.NaAc.5.4]PNR96631.1 methenyltetrahydrofolate cyclohydrolase [Petrotoga sp. 9PWA.NaAc.5.4]
MFSNITIKEFLEKLSSKEPTPGGGSVAALAGALASSLGCMVSNLTIGKKKYMDVEEEIKKVYSLLEEYQNKFLEEMEEDAKAFNKVIEALKLPKNTEEEKKIREEKIQEATKEATLTPLKIAQDALEVMELTEIIVKKGYKMALSDAAIAGIMAKTAVISGIYNVKINLPLLKDQEFVKELKRKIENMETEANFLELRIISEVTL